MSSSSGPHPSTDSLSTEYAGGADQRKSDSQVTSLSAASAADTELAAAIIDAGLASRTELEFCREQQKQSSDPNQRSITDLLVEHSFVTVNQVKRLRQLIDEKKKSQIPGYQLLGKVGKGAMAVVYKGRQISLDRIVAIKVLPKRMSDNPDFVSRFYKEGRAAARLSHNNIVQAIDVGSSPEGYHYFVMEYVEGPTLYDLMQPPPIGENKLFAEAEALDVCIQIADALLHAHQRGLIHRDVKPKNILLTPDGVAKLTDLGLARDVDDKAAAETEAGKAYGTPYYISPEQIRGELDIDFRADLYSLGATLYHLVTGRPPFEGETPSAVMHRHLKDPLIPPDHLNTRLSSGLGEVVEFAMAKRKEDRYLSTADMLEDLRAVRNGQFPSHARQTVDIGSLEAIAPQRAKTVDMPVQVSLMESPVFIVLLVVAGLSVVVNLVMLVMSLS